MSFAIDPTASVCHSQSIPLPVCVSFAINPTASVVGVLLKEINTAPARGTSHDIQSHIHTSVVYLHGIDANAVCQRPEEAADEHQQMEHEDILNQGHLTG